MKVLIPTQPEEPGKTRSAVETAIKLYADQGAAVHLLSVQPRISGHVAMCFAPGELQGIVEQAAREEFEEARQRLDALRVPYSCRVIVGRRAESIAEVARELNCDRILLGSQEKPRAHERLFGSLAQQLRHILGAGGGVEVIGY
ncbi:MAG: universal stress protein [Burkholderiales bacterium]|nr:universal stress protein [Burkholderiales bacterium]